MPSWRQRKLKCANFAHIWQRIHVAHNTSEQSFEILFGLQKVNFGARSRTSVHPIANIIWATNMHFGVSVVELIATNPEADQNSWGRAGKSGICSWLSIDCPRE
mmetsp:Transcript_17049/g.39407  ORF Transcript_17049/g.39407 Transcript_17049/m.39407 type:complete len:104 (+) Transcript_17049:4104-4415(+)